jgi:hypothetical protein
MSSRFQRSQAPSPILPPPPQRQDGVTSTADGSADFIAVPDVDEGEIQGEVPEDIPRRIAYVAGRRRNKREGRKGNATKAEGGATKEVQNRVQKPVPRGTSPQSSMEMY